MKVFGRLKCMEATAPGPYLACPRLRCQELQINYRPTNTTVVTRCNIGLTQLQNLFIFAKRVTCGSSRESWNQPPLFVLIYCRHLSEMIGDRTNGLKHGKKRKMKQENCWSWSNRFVWWIV